MGIENLTNTEFAKVGVWYDAWGYWELRWKNCDLWEIYYHPIKFVLRPLPSWGSQNKSEPTMRLVYIFYFRNI